MTFPAKETNKIQKEREAAPSQQAKKSNHLLRFFALSVPSFPSSHPPPPSFTSTLPPYPRKRTKIRLFIHLSYLFSSSPIPVTHTVPPSLLPSFLPLLYLFTLASSARIWSIVALYASWVRGFFKIALPATKKSAPASAISLMLATPTPPSTSRRMS